MNDKDVTNENSGAADEVVQAGAITGDVVQGPVISGNARVGAVATVNHGDNYINMGDFWSSK
ncbi:hypothetical protein LCD36_04785 [Saccharopolyspora sp. 6T]|uniref:hypothetical protein n=1 Tax=Saccharopolyspora sp. 6T TaxID=2877238 RepID=UPI001CD4302B|nr:hypothetical protein [Saccharopolyspora sp. 6T]MCA1185768.1 hypothetical protein [Saccharopolyspora sp. 6T]